MFNAEVAEIFSQSPQEKAQKPHCIRFGNSRVDKVAENLIAFACAIRYQISNRKPQNSYSSIEFISSSVISRL